MPARRRGGGSGDGDGGSFTPTQSNLYAIVKAIFHPSSNPGVTADDANRELDVAGASGSQRPVAAATDVNAVAATGAALSSTVTGSKSGLDNTRAITLWSLLSILSKVLKTASATVRGVVLLARNEDVDASETDTSRVPDVARVKRLIQRISTGVTNLSIAARTATAVTIGSSSGTDAIFPSASATQAGAFPAAAHKQTAALPVDWRAKVWAVGEQAAWARRVYRCKAARTVQNTDNPAVDTTGWEPLGAGGGANIAVSEETSQITAALRSLKFVGTTVTASDDGSGNVTVTISGGGTTPAPADDFLFGVSDDATPVAGELTIVAPNGSASIAAYAGSKHVLIARLASEADIASIKRSDDVAQINQIGAFTKHSSAIAVSGNDYNVWVSNQALTQDEAVTWSAS